MCDILDIRVQGVNVNPRFCRDRPETAMQVSFFRRNF